MVSSRAMDSTMTPYIQQKNRVVQRMNYLAALFLAAWLAFVAWFSLHAWHAQKLFIVGGQESVLEFASRHIDGHFYRIEVGYLRLSHEILEGQGTTRDSQYLLIDGLKKRAHDLLSLDLTFPGGPTLKTNDNRSEKRDERPFSYSYIKPSEKPGIYRDYWNSDVRAKYQLAIEQENSDFENETHTLITRYYHSDKSGKHRLTLSGVLRISILRDYWLSSETLKQSNFWIAGDNGSLIQLYPARIGSRVENESNQRIAESLQERFRQSGFPEKGLFETQWDITSASQVVVFQRLANYPFTVVLAIPSTVILSNWWRQVQVPFALSLLLFFVGLVSYRNTLKNQRLREAQAARMQEQLRISNERWKLAVECAGESLWEAIWKPTGIRLSWHSSEAGALPGGEENMPIEHWSSYIHPEDQLRVRECLEAYFLGTLSEFQIEHRILGKHGQWKWFLVRGNAIKRDSNGKPLHVLGTLTDITFQKIHQQQVEEREGRWRQGIILLPTGFSVLSGEGRVVEANPALCRMFGYTEKEMVGMPLEQFFDRESTDGNLFGFEFPVVGNLPYTTLERIAIHKSGHRFPVVYKVSTIAERNGGTINFIAQIEDLSERRRAHLQDTAREILQAQEKDRAQLSRELHDEVGQSLTALRLTLKLAYDSMEDARKAESRINDGQRILDELISCIRNIANRIRPTAIDQLGLVSAVRAHIAKNIRPLGLHITFSENLGKNRLPAPLELCCFRVIQEALTNCLRHARATDVKVSLSKTGSRVWISVQDNGVGFDISRYYALLEEKGSLGITGMHERVAAVGGQLQIRSTPGQGTEVVAAFNLTEDKEDKGAS